MIRVLLVLQLLFATPTADISWIARQWHADTVFAMTYPAPVTRLVEGCIVFYEGHWGQGDYSEWQRHCWTPTNSIVDFDTWPNMVYDKVPYNVLGYITFINLKGERETHWAFPLEGDS